MTRANEEQKADHQIALPNIRSYPENAAMDSDNHKDNDDDDDDERLDVVGTTDSHGDPAHGKDEAPPLTSCVAAAFVSLSCPVSQAPLAASLCAARGSVSGTFLPSSSSLSPFPWRRVSLFRARPAYTD